MCVRAHARTYFKCKNVKKKSAEGVFRECCVVWVEDNTKGPQMIIVNESLNAAHFIVGVFF